MSFTLLGVSVALPVLDAREGSDTPSIEAAHDPGRCSIHHDHAACSQLARSHAVQTGPSASPDLGPEIEKAAVVRNEAPRVVGRCTSALPRAPPSIA